ncbi:hypothetical protein GCM10023321_43970 [Pseudonocardia eucalypti]|uniref:NlpC/P60 domain-containing protein n=1 Tax=Pseudonocardia eucalypti TaxID=648755 RepID=A0ABP9QEX2_9PSEU
MGAHRARRGVQATTRFAAFPVAEVPARPVGGPAHARPAERQRALSAVAMTAVGAGAAVTMTGTLAAVPTVPPPPTPADTGTFAQPITLAADQAATPRAAQTAPAPAAVAAPVAPAGQATPLAAPASVIIGDAPSVVPAPDLAAPTAAVAPTALPVPAAVIAAIPAQAAAPAIEAIPAPALAAPAAQPLAAPTAQPLAVPAAQPLAAPAPAVPVAAAPAPVVQPAALAPAAAPAAAPAPAPAAPVQQAKNIAAPGALGALATPAPAAAGGTVAAVDLHQTGANEIAALSRSIDIGQQAVQTAQAAAAQAAKPIFQGKPLPTAALEKAMTKIGRPYVWGAVGPGSFDCSGLVQWAYKQIGKDLPRTSRQQSQVGTPVSRDQLQPGDLVFFNSPVSHVGIYVGDNKILNAVETGRPVQITSMARQKFHNARRI